MMPCWLIMYIFPFEPAPDVFAFQYETAILVSIFVQLWNIIAVQKLFKANWQLPAFILFFAMKVYIIFLHVTKVGFKYRA